MTPRQPDELSEHQRWEELAVGSALHALEPADEEAFAGHLPVCDSCRRLVDEMNDVAGELAYTAGPTDPPPWLWSGISAAVTSSDRPPLPPPSESAPPRRTRAITPAAENDPEPAGGKPVWLRSTALALVAGLIGIVGLSGVVLFGRYMQVRSNKAAADRQLSAVLNCAASAGCSVVPLKAQAGSAASAVALVRAGNLQLVVNRLPPTDRNSTYVLWVGNADSSMTGVGKFLNPSTGRHLISPDLTSATANLAGRTLAVTREPGRRIPARPSTPPTLVSAA